MLLPELANDVINEKIFQLLTLLRALVGYSKFSNRLFTVKITRFKHFLLFKLNNTSLLRLISIFFTIYFRFFTYKKRLEKICIRLRYKSISFFEKFRMPIRISKITILRDWYITSDWLLLMGWARHCCFLSTNNKLRELADLFPLVKRMFSTNFVKNIFFMIWCINHGLCKMSFLAPLE